MHQIRRMTGFIIVLGLLINPAFLFAQEVQSFDLKLGIISNKSGKRIREFVEVVNYLADHSEVINKGIVIVTEDVQSMSSKIQAGEVNMVFETAFPIIKLEEKNGLIPALILWKKGVRQYRTLFFVKSDSPLRTLQDLKGKIIAFENPESTSAYAIPKAELLRNKIRVATKEGTSLDGDAIRYLFAQQEKNQVFYVLQRKADAAAFNNNDWDELSKAMKAELRIIHETKPIIRYLAGFAPQMPLAMRDAVSSALLSMSDDPEGKKVLQKAFKIKKVEKLLPADHESLEYVKSLTRFAN